MLATDSEEEEEDGVGVAVCGGFVSQLPVDKISSSQQGMKGCKCFQCVETETGAENCNQTESAVTGAPETVQKELSVNF